MSTVPPLRQAGSLSVLYTVPGMEAVRVEANLPYAPERTPAHRMDLYLPPAGEAEGPFPVVILIHGSAPASARLKDMRPFVSWGQLVAASGMGAVTFNWDYPQGEQIEEAIAFVRTEGAALGLDTTRLALVAFSGGVSEGVLAGLRGTPDDVRAIVAFYGDLRAAQAQLADEAPGEVAPLLVIRAGEDEAIPAAYIEDFVAAATERGVRLEYLVHPTGVHAFDLRNDDEQTRTIVRRSIEFLQEALEGE